MISCKYLLACNAGCFLRRKELVHGSHLASYNEDGLWAARVVLEELGGVVHLALIHKPGALPARMLLHLATFMIVLDSDPGI
jgi:hypothetical protein